MFGIPRSREASLSLPQNFPILLAHLANTLTLSREVLMAGSYLSSTGSQPMRRLIASGPDSPTTVKTWPIKLSLFIIAERIAQIVHGIDSQSWPGPQKDLIAHCASGEI